MTWLRIDDGFEDHLKVEDLSDAAHRLWVRAGCWCKKPVNASTNGFVPRAKLRAICRNKVTQKRAETLAQELVDATGGGVFRNGLWEVRENGWQFHDWEVYQPEREAMSRSEAARVAGRRSAERRLEVLGTARPTGRHSRDIDGVDVSSRGAKHESSSGAEVLVAERASGGNGQSTSGAGLFGTSEASPPERPPDRAPNDVRNDVRANVRRTSRTPGPDPDPGQRSHESEVLSQDLTGQTRENRPPEDERRDLPSNYRNLEQSFWQDESSWHGPRAFHADFARQNGLDLGLEERQYRANRRKQAFRCADFDADFEDWLARSVKFLRKNVGPASERPVTAAEKRSSARLLKLGDKFAAEERLAEEEREKAHG